MVKILLVEDDNNLREIFEMRLQADGYQTVTAGNGEEGLTVAMKERPDLIIADVMMPKLSGFDMLENLRAVPEMKDVKVIMMTALGQAEDQRRGESLGVVKYLVKSQATLEDFARTVREVLPPGGASTPPANQNQQAQNNQQGEESMQNDQSDPTTNNMPADGASAPADGPSMPPAAPAADPGAPQTTEQEQGMVNDQIDSFASASDNSGMGGSDVGGSMPADPAAGSTVSPGGAEAAEPASTQGPAVPPATPPAPEADNPPAQSETPSTPDNSGSL